MIGVYYLSSHLIVMMVRTLGALYSIFTVADFRSNVMQHIINGVAWLHFHPVLFVCSI